MIANPRWAQWTEWLAIAIKWTALGWHPPDEGIMALLSLCVRRDRKLEIERLHLSDAQVAQIMALYDAEET